MRFNYFAQRRKYAMEASFFILYFFYFLFFTFYFSSCKSHPDEVPPVKKEVVIIYKEREEKKPLPVNRDTSYLEYVFAGKDLVSIKDLDSTIKINLKYSDTSNFLKINLYDGLRNAYLTCDAALRLASAQCLLKQQNKHLSLVVFDAARPLHIQQIMWDSLKMPDSVKVHYLALPNQTSLHNYGCAVDVGIYNDSAKKMLDMGTEYDTFNKLSQPFYELVFIRDSTLSPEAYQNRKLLRSVMKRAGYASILSEWWHFSICTKPQAVLKYKLIF